MTDHGSEKVTSKPPVRLAWPNFTRRVVVCLDERPRRTEDGIDILPARVFAERLWDDRLIPT